MKYEVRKSAIHGRGCFATETIKRNELIGKMKSVKTEREGAYVLWIGDNIRYKITCKLRFINHSDKPNVAVYDNLEVYALKRIEPGEELVFDYGPDFRTSL